MSSNRSTCTNISSSIKRQRDDEDGNDDREQKITKQQRNIIVSVAKQQQQQQQQPKSSSVSSSSPLMEYVKTAFKDNGCCNDDDDIEWIAKNCSMLCLSKPYTQEMIDSYYGMPELVNSVRENDLSKVKQLYDDGRLTCNACNPFGESILHIACRRGHLQMIRFLIDTVAGGLGLSIFHIKDDFHRTPLHDTFWSASKDKFQIVDYLLKHNDPQNNVVELLLMKDKRGFTPLDYARKDEHAEWFQFFQERKSFLRSSSSSSSSSSSVVVKQPLIDNATIPTSSQLLEHQFHDSNSSNGCKNQNNGYDKKKSIVG